jgi:hypothetical protein
MTQPVSSLKEIPFKIPNLQTRSHTAPSTPQTLTQRVGKHGEKEGNLGSVYHAMRRVLSDGGSTKCDVCAKHVH